MVAAVLLDLRPTYQVTAQIVEQQPFTLELRPSYEALIEVQAGNKLAIELQASHAIAIEVPEQKDLALQMAEVIRGARGPRGLTGPIGPQGNPGINFTDFYFTAVHDGAFLIQLVLTDAQLNSGNELFVNGLLQASNAYGLSNSGMQIPTDLNVMVGDVINFKYFR